MLILLMAITNRIHDSTDIVNTFCDIVNAQNVLIHQPSRILSTGFRNSGLDLRKTVSVTSFSAGTFLASGFHKSFVHFPQTRSLHRNQI